MAEGADLVDVRSSDEYRGDHLEGSVNLPLDQIEQQAGTQLPNQQRPEGSGLTSFPSRQWRRRSKAGKGVPHA